MDEQLVDAHVRALIELHARAQSSGQAGMATTARGPRREICEQIAPEAPGAHPAGDAHDAHDAHDVQGVEAHAERSSPAGFEDGDEREAKGDPLLVTLAQAAARREAADGLIRLLVAYAREITPGRYPLSVLAQASGISPSGLRTSYSPQHLDLVHQVLAEVDDARDHAAASAGDQTPTAVGDALDGDLATVTSLLDRLTGPASPGDSGRGAYLSEEQLRARLREILLGDD